MQRLDCVEEKFSELESSVYEMVNQAMEHAKATMKQSIVEQIVVSQVEASKQNGVEIQGMGERSKGRITDLEMIRRCLSSC